jgi:N-acetylglucosaminyl-diphospho-decaprenol L-rhamnosyltransferase
VSHAITAVVVTFHSGSTIDRCLRCLRAASDVAEIRVVDNASADDTLQIVQQHALADPRVRFIANPDNPGFAAACNQGAVEGSAPWLAFVNPDLMVEPDTLARLRELAQGRGDCMLGVEQVDAQGRADEAVRRRDPDFAAMLRSPGAGSRLAVAADRSRELQEVDAISGALMLMPRALFDRLGGLARAAAQVQVLGMQAVAGVQAGATVAIANGLQVLHVRGVSSRARPFFVEWHKHRGLWRYFIKFEAASRPWPMRMAVWLAIWAHAAVQVPRILLRG